MKNVTALIVAVVIVFGSGAVCAFADFDEDNPLVSAAEAAGRKVRPNCDRENDRDAAYRKFCGERLRKVETVYRLCPECVEGLEADQEYCAKSGSASAPALSRTRGVWGSSVFVPSVNITPLVASEKKIILGGELGYMLTEYVMAGPRVGLSGDGGPAVGVNARVYFNPYFEGFFLKPHIGAGTGVILHAEKPNEFFFNFAGGPDFRIVNSRAIFYVSGGIHENYCAGSSETYLMVDVGLRVAL